MPSDHLARPDRLHLRELRTNRSELAQAEEHRRYLLAERRRVLRVLHRRGVGIGELVTATGLTRQHVHRLVRRSKGATP